MWRNSDRCERRASAGAWAQASVLMHIPVWDSMEGSTGKEFYFRRTGNLGMLSLEHIECGCSTLDRQILVQDSSSVMYMYVNDANNYSATTISTVLRMQQ